MSEKVTLDEEKGIILIHSVGNITVDDLENSVETAKGETTYQLTFVNLKLFEESEQNNEQRKR